MRLEGARRGHGEGAWGGGTEGAWRGYVLDMYGEGALRG